MNMIVDYVPSKQCKNKNVMYTCNKCGRCGRKFEDGIMIDQGETQPKRADDISENEYMVTMPFPAFEKSIMYKGMKSGKGYSLNELEL